jgi:hypothetical protein
LIQWKNTAGYTFKTLHTIEYCHFRPHHLNTWLIPFLFPSGLNSNVNSRILPYYTIVPLSFSISLPICWLSSKHLILLMSF